MRVLLPLLLTLTMAFSSIGLAEVKVVPFAGGSYGFAPLSFPKENDEGTNFGMRTKNIKGSVGASLVINNLHQIEPYLAYTKIDVISAGVTKDDGSKEASKIEGKSSVGFNLYGLGVGYQINPTISPSLSIGVGPFVEYLTGKIENCYEDPWENPGTVKCETGDASEINLGLMASLTVAKYITPYAQVMYSKGEFRYDNFDKKFEPTAYTVLFGVRGNLDIFGK